MNRKLATSAGALMAMLTGTLVSGCGSPARTESRPIQEAEPFSEVAVLAGGLLRYIDVHGSPPASKEDFRDFCTSAGLPCGTLDWSTLSWECVDNKKLVVVYKSETYSLPITMEKRSGSLDADVMRQQLEEQCRDPRR